MELKLYQLVEVGHQLLLLIVPYGIETALTVTHTYSNRLLIVPYGIETWGYGRTIPDDSYLLIVPYGIETSYLSLNSSSSSRF